MSSARRKPYSRPSERDKPRLPPPGPSQPYPQFVWLTEEPNEGVYENDGKTPYRDLFMLTLGKPAWRKWKRTAADLQQRTLYYVADDLTDPSRGSDLPVLHHRVDKWSSSFNFHENLDILTPDTHSAALIDLVGSYRQKRRERVERQRIREEGGMCPSSSSESESEQSVQSDEDTREYNDDGL